MFMKKLNGENVVVRSPPAMVSWMQQEVAPKVSKHGVRQVISFSDTNVPATSLVVLADTWAIG